uniref:Protein phosphatase 1 regulatory subunit 1C n=1 Tax=Cairina moschata TaxID=8855 RepID=A0A8C3D4B8_CAIMO
MEPNSPKKIQFAVPLFQSQIDPEAAELSRPRSLTVSLSLLNHQSQSASPKQRKQSVYTPPALKGTVQVLRKQRTKYLSCTH